MPHLKRTEDWGVLDATGQWIVWHVSEKEARAIYKKRKDAVLCSDIDTDEEAGGESHCEVERKGDVHFD